MKLQRTKNASQGIIYGVILKSYQTIIPFLMRTLMIYYIGVKYLGLSSIFSSVLSVLSLAELGVGYAMVFSMYDPIAKDDKKTICALLRLYKLYYRTIGLVILIGGLLIIPFLHRLIKGDVPDNINIYILYGLYLGATVLSYWLFAYKNSLLSAYQRNDVSSKILIATSTINYLMQLISILVFKNYYLYILSIIISQITTNLITAIIVAKLYPNYHATGRLDNFIIKDIHKRIKALIYLKIGGTIANSVNTIVISSFIGLSALAIYDNYFYIITSLITFFSIIYKSSTAGIGNSLCTESIEKNYKDFEKITFIILWLTGFCFCCLICLYQPFMKIWVGPELTLNYNVVVCFCIYFYIYEFNSLLSLYKDASGLWHQDRYRPIITAMINIILSLVLVRYIGIFGIIISTILSFLFVGLPWIVKNVFKNLFKISPKIYIKKVIRYILSTIIASFITYLICKFIPDKNILNFMFKILVCLVMPNFIFFLLFHRLDEFRSSLNLVKNILPNKIVRKFIY